MGDLTRPAELQILARWYCFFQRPSLYLHESRLADYVDQSILDQLSNLPPMSRLHHYMSEHILQHHPELVMPPMALSEELWSILSTPGEHFPILAKFLGALELGPWIRRCIGGNEMRVVSETLGVDVLRFVRTRHAGIYTGSEKHRLLNSDNFAASVKNCGYSWLARIGSLMPENMQMIWQLRLPKNVSVDLVGEMPISRLMPFFMAARRVCFSQ